MGSSDAQRKSRGGSMKRQKTWEDGCEQVVAGKKRFVGVRQRPSGRWVAEIKDTTQKIRLWLGTFDSAEEGAKAYDSAARALRGANTRTNFVTALSSCESTPSKATRLIRLRQIAAANAKLQAEAARLGHGGADELLRHDVSPQPTCSSDSDERHSQVATPPPLSVSCSSPPKPARREIAPSGSGTEHIEPVASSPHGNLPRDTAAASPPPPPPPCCNSTSEAAALATANRETSAVSAFSCSSESSSLHSCATSGASSSSDPVDAMIPWSDYVLVDGLDLPSTCEFAVYASAFDFSAEAMDRDSCTTSDLLEDHTTSLRDSDVDDSTEFPNFAMSSESTDMDRVDDVGDAETCSSHDLVWSRYKGRCAAT